MAKGHEDLTLSCAESIMEGAFSEEQIAAAHREESQMMGSQGGKSVLGAPADVVQFGIIRTAAASTMETTSQSPRPESCKEESFGSAAKKKSISIEESFSDAARRQSCSRVVRSQHTVNNLLSFSMKSDGPKEEAAPPRFIADVEATRKRLRDLNRRTIDPRSQFVRIWDGVTVIALIFTAFVTPFEVGFFEKGGIEEAPITFVLNRIIDSIFICDVILAFFLPYRESIKNGGMMVYDNKRIALAYLKSWFGLDVLTCIPFDLLFAGIAAASGMVVDSQMFRLLRMLRLIKLMRVVRASRILSRWQDHIGISYAMLSLAKFSVITFVLAHWLACLWAFVGSSTGEPYTGFESGLTWRQKHRVQVNATSDAIDHASLYSVCLYVALNNIFGGACEINPANYEEFAIQSMMLLVGSSMWAYIIGSACGIIATLDPARIEVWLSILEIKIPVVSPFAHPPRCVPAMFTVSHDCGRAELLHQGSILEQRPRHQTAELLPRNQPLCASQAI